MTRETLKTKIKTPNHSELKIRMNDDVLSKHTVLVRLKSTTQPCIYNNKG